MTKLFYSPGACSLGIHVLLEEIGKPYELSAVSLKDGAQFKPAFTSVNPKSKVPTLARDDGSVLTEFPAIALWLARTNPQAKLVPEDAESQARMMEALEYIVSTIHMQGFSRLFGPGKYAPSEADHPAVLERGREIASKGLELIAKALGSKDYVVGQFSIADAALFYVENWCGMKNVPLPAACAGHLARMRARPSVQRALKQEGLAA